MVDGKIWGATHDFGDGLVPGPDGWARVSFWEMTRGWKDQRVEDSALEVVHSGRVRVRLGLRAEHGRVEDVVCKISEISFVFLEDQGKAHR